MKNRQKTLVTRLTDKEWQTSPAKSQNSLRDHVTQPKHQSINFRLIRNQVTQAYTFHYMLHSISRRQYVKKA